MLAVRPSYRAPAWRVAEGDKYFQSRLSLQSLLISSLGTSDNILDQHHTRLAGGWMGDGGPGAGECHPQSWYLEPRRRTSATLTLEPFLLPFSSG